MLDLAEVEVEMDRRRRRVCFCLCAFRCYVVVVRTGAKCGLLVLDTIRLITRRRLVLAGRREPSKLVVLVTIATRDVPKADAVVGSDG